MPWFSFDGRNKQNEINDLVAKRERLLQENRTKKSPFSSPIENDLIRKANMRQIREIENRLDELAIA